MFHHKLFLLLRQDTFLRGDVLDEQCVVIFTKCEDSSAFFKAGKLLNQNTLTEFHYTHTHMQNFLLHILT